MYHHPDVSQYLIHFTKKRKPDSAAHSNPALKFTDKSAKERLIGILETKQIIATKLTTGNSANACCLTECVWGSLLDHARRYSSYGIGFTKEFIYRQKGNPVFYVAPELFDTYKKDNVLLPYLALYDLQHRKHIDFTHEREWRIPETLKFTLKDVAFIIIKSYADSLDFDKYIKRNGYKIRYNDGVLSQFSDVMEDAQSVRCVKD